MENKSKNILFNVGMLVVSYLDEVMSGSGIVAAGGTKSIFPT